MLKTVAALPSNPSKIAALQEDFEDALLNLLKDRHKSRLVLQRAAIAFHDLVAETLGQAGLDYTKAAVSDLLGEEESQYRHVLEGRRGSAAKIAYWFTVWNLTWASATFPTVDASRKPFRVHGRETAFDRLESTKEEKDQAKEEKKKNLDEAIYTEKVARIAAINPDFAKMMKKPS